MVKSAIYQRIFQRSDPYANDIVLTRFTCMRGTKGYARKVTTTGCAGGCVFRQNCMSFSRNNPLGGFATVPP